MEYVRFNLYEIKQYYAIIILISIKTTLHVRVARVF